MSPVVMADNDNADLERKWRAELERLGPEVINARLRDNPGFGRGAIVYLETDDGLLEPLRGFIEDWLSDYERQREDTSRNRFLIIVAIGLLGILATILAR